jgi:hypothetical protein
VAGRWPVATDSQSHPLVQCVSSDTTLLPHTSALCGSPMAAPKCPMARLKPVLCPSAMVTDNTDETLSMRLTVIGGERSADDYQVIWRGLSIGRIMRASGVPHDRPTSASASRMALLGNVMFGQISAVALMVDQGATSVVGGRALLTTR